MDVHPRAKSDVDGGIQVCGEEDDALEVLQFAEEDCFALVPFLNFQAITPQKWEGEGDTYSTPTHF